MNKNEEQWLASEDMTFANLMIFTLLGASFVGLLHILFGVSMLWAIVPIAIGVYLD